jgi:hypothetical protein
MPQQIINIGAAANDRTGDTWRDAMDKSNDNFTELYGSTLTNVVAITQESDFPIQDASTITLEAGKIYWLQNNLTTSKTIVCADGTVYTGMNQRGIVHTYTGSGDAFIGTDVDFIADRIGLSCTNTAAQYFNFTETVGGTQVFALNFCDIEGFGKIGTFDEYGGVNFIQSSAIGVNDGISFSGTSSLVASIFKLLIVTTDPAFVGIDLGASVSGGWDFTDFACQGPVGAVGISGLANSGNVPTGFLGMINGGFFAGGMTPTVNVLPNDIRWEIQDNASIANSRNASDVYLDGGAETITVSVTGDFYEIGVPTAGGVSWSSDIEDRFSVGTDGVITYIGEKDIEAQIIGRATVEKTGGGSDELEVRIAKNWTGAGSDQGLYKSRAITDNTSPTSVPVGALIPLSQNDNIRMIFANNDSTSNIIVDVSSIEVTG